MISFWGVNFHLYGLILGLGILVAKEVVYKVARERKIEEKKLDRLFFAVIIGGIVGARLYNVLDNLTYYSENVVKIFMIWDGGLGIWGAIAGGLTALQLLILIFKFSIANSIWDLAAIGMPIVQAIGRWGNFFNNEIIGKNGEPLFLCESLATLILFLIIYRLRNKKKYKLMGIYLIGYGGVRLLLEGFRIPSDTWMIGNISVSGVLSLAAILWGFIWQR